MNRCSEPLNRAKGETMKKDAKRFMISVSTELFERLSVLQTEDYSQGSRNEMLVDLIRRGLESVKHSAPLTETKEKKE